MRQRRCNFGVVYFNITMKKVFIAAALLLGVARAQSGRYFDPVFAALDSTKDVVYGRAALWSGDTIDLHLDVFEPSGDTETLRPLVVFIHGGGFLEGTKANEEVVQFCRSLARRGYVTASIQYRLGVDLDSIGGDVGERQIVRAAVRATHDAKAAVRFFRARAGEWRIDPDKIYLGGSSAGGVTAMHTAYMNSEAKFLEVAPRWLWDEMGGLEGASGTPGVSSAVQGAINLNGTLTRSGWVETATPLLNVAATADSQVPFVRGYAGLPGVAALAVDGPYLLDSAARAEGVWTRFLVFPGAGHVPYITPGPNRAAYQDTTDRFLRDGLYTWTTGQSVSRIRPRSAQIRVFPTRFADGFNVESVGPVSVALYDAAGKNVFSESAPEGGFFRPRLGTGVYFLTVRTENDYFSGPVFVDKE